MKDWLKNTNWGELFFPVLADLKNINEETDTTRVSSNNWDLANDNEDFKEIIEKINENRSSEDTKHNIIVL
ncbi:hypothetical protein [Flavobacterium luminosum]|uniref:Uncharacterized protein n=1 Tax=Flavobacterium luminosum TaxID=2949086 RepID=A0ABT0TNH9_9FLAO|nr:hypothetical protein [Flavobacterium sp. HXWNR70]MCL9808930.1 hypothetical protein [Flavobacterium sp. HXWNR70]